MTTCMGRPISWLDLERSNLGELSQSEQQNVTAHAEACEACSACLDLIESDKRILRPLPRSEQRDTSTVFHRFRFAFAAGVATTAAMVLITSFVFMSRDRTRESLGPQAISAKGGALALTLLRERDGLIVENPRVYLSGDRFSLLVTCPWPVPVEWDVVVFQAGEAFFPISAGAPISCGNRVLLPGAVRLTGNLPTTMCLLIGDKLPDREDLASSGLEALPRNTICYEIKPASGDDSENE